MLKRVIERSITNAPRVRTFASRPSPEAEFNFIPATQADLPRLVDIASTDFIRTEPHSVALGLTAAGTKPLFEWIVGKALHYPYSYVLTEKATDQVIGFRLLSVGHRDAALDFTPFHLVLEGKAQILGEILDGLKGRFWAMKPEINTVLRREITFVTRRHQRKGIAGHLLHLGLDFDKLKADGIQGIVSEASSHANQTLLARNGYQHLCDADRSTYVDKNGKPLFSFDDETKTVKLMFKPL